MESCVNDLRKWMIQDKLKLNDGKIELLIIGSKQQLQKLNPCHVGVGNADVVQKSVTTVQKSVTTVQISVSTMQKSVTN
jgi:hypothetical protein